MLTVVLPQQKMALSLTGTTGEDGTLTFGKESGQTMKYNTVYCLTETAAPEGYVMDAAPHYFAVVASRSDGSYPTFPNGVTVWYQSADYTYQAYNHKGEATVAKAFLDVGGNHLAKSTAPTVLNLYRSKSHRRSAANGDHHIRK
ncbi:MAG: prealbumin-like fold domain-containing protein [Acutalibacteraceae bacterium]